MHQFPNKPKPNFAEKSSEPQPGTTDVTDELPQPSTTDITDEINLVPASDESATTLDDPAIEGNRADSTNNKALSDSASRSKLQPVYIFEEALIGKYCIVRYDNEGYPSVIEDADQESIRVNCMHRVGRNRFFWPHRDDNDIWYEYTDVITLIPQPEHVTDRHYQVEPSIWEEVVKNLDDWVKKSYDI